MAPPFDPDEFQQQVEKALREGGEMPSFPEFTPMTGLAVAQNEMVKEYENAGFSRSEALYMTAATFNGHPGSPPPGMED